MCEFIFSEIEYWLSKGMSEEDCAKALCDIYGKDYDNAMLLVRLCYVLGKTMHLSTRKGDLER